MKLLIQRRWLHSGSLMNFSQCIQVNGFRVSPGMMPEDAKQWAQRLAGALNYRKPVRCVGRWKANR